MLKCNDTTLRQFLISSAGKTTSDKYFLCHNGPIWYNQRAKFVYVILMCYAADIT